jgi:Leucine-rich repeat (LRR) protein
MLCFKHLAPFQSLCLIFACVIISACGPSAEFQGESLVDDNLQQYGVLSWNADSDTIDGFTIDRLVLSPDIGEVDFTGSLTVYPNETTTYRLLVETSNSNGLLYQYYRNVTVHIGPRVDYNVVQDDAFKQCLSENNYTHLEQFEVIYCLDRGIQNLSGIEQFNLTQSVSLDNNQVTDLTPLTALPKLNTVSLSGNALTDLSGLSQSTSIRNIAAHNNAITDISALRLMPQLLNLTLDQNIIEDTSPLATLTELQGLSITANQITNAAPLANITSLLALDISNNPITSGITELNTLTKASVIRSENNAQVLCLDYAKLVLDLGPIVLFNKCRLF